MKTLRLRDVKARVGLGHTTLYELMKQQAFPRPIRLSPNRVAWLENDVQRWLDERVAERDANSSCVFR